MSPQTAALLAYSAIAVQGLFVVALLFAGLKLSEWTKETRRERIAANAQVRSNQHVVDFLARQTHTDPSPLHSDNEEVA